MEEKLEFARGKLGIQFSPKDKLLGTSQNNRFDADDFVRCVDDNDFDGFLTLVNISEQDSQIDQAEYFSLPIFKDVPLLHYICKKSDISPEFVKMLLHKGVSVDLQYEEVRPVHIACIHNCPKTLELLLEYNARVLQGVETAWGKGSPFYIASVSGHLDIVRILLSHAPKYVKEDDIRSCLLYAACFGGNRNVVNVWYSPGMDLNHPRVFVDDVSLNCSNETPLFAACSGNHYEVAKYLVELGAELKKQVCEEFPEITGKIFQENATETLFEDEGNISDNDLKQIELNYSRRDVRYIHRDWLQPWKLTMVDLDISWNKLEELPDTIPWMFPKLIRFNAANNLLSSLASPTEPVECIGLTEIHLSNNKLTSVCPDLFQLPSLEILNLSYNKLEYIVKTHQQQFDWQKLEASPKGQRHNEWSCKNLSRLNLSYNELKMLPPDMKRCTSLTVLDASHNQVTSFPGAWDCPLSHLNLSNNKLDMFPADIHLYWCGSLRILNLSYNELDSLKESTVKLCALTDLIVTDNKICYLPDPSEWDCKQLYALDLRNNCLGFPSGPGSSTPVTPKKSRPFRVSKVLSNVSDAIILPRFLEHCLHDLNLRNNSLDCVPKGICHLTSLVNLDISCNPGIKELPKEMGQLCACSNLTTDGQKIVGYPGDLPSDVNLKSREIISHLRHELRKSRSYNKLKLVILGKKDKGKTTLAGLLSNTVMPFQESGVNRFTTMLSGTIMPRPGLARLRKAPPDISFSVWDMSSSRHYTAVQQCFFTKNSLYLLVWDIWSLKKDLDTLGKLLYTIEAQTPNSQVILVATFLDRNVTSERDVKVASIISEVVERYGIDSGNSHLCSRLERHNIVPVSCSTKEGIQELKQKIYEIATKIPDPSNRSKKLINRKIPQTYFKLEEAIGKICEEKTYAKLPPFLENEEFQDLINGIPENDITTPKEQESVVEFLVESGSMLHFSDRIKGLNNLYFMDPSWLCDLLAKVLIDGDTKQLIRGGKIGVSPVKVLFQDDPRFPVEYLNQYIQLLERFEIALSVDSGRKYFIPSQLSENPGLEFHAEDNIGKSVCRLYQMAFIPTGFWTRLLSRIMARIELLESRDWALTPKRKLSSKLFGMSRMVHTVVGREFSGSCGGLRIKEKDMVYWQDGMCVRHDKGFFKIESIRVPQMKGRPPQNGVMVVVSSHVEEFSIMGMIVDEIDDLLADHYPGLSEWDDNGQPLVQRFALCPQCNDFSNPSLLDNINHFTVEHCARLILSSDTISCRKGYVLSLKHLVPELLIQELPKQYHLDVKDLKDYGKLLGRGVSGSVYKGKYGNTDVAVKYYHDSQRYGVVTGLASTESGIISDEETEESDKPDESLKPEETVNNFEKTQYANYNEICSQSHDTDEPTSIKTWRAFSEMRQEVAVTSKLQHPCVVSFIGICVRPRLLMCLEFAPLGSLRGVLDDQMKDRKPFNKYRDRDKIFDTVMSKDITYKVLSQIALGLEYLHKNSIIYRDLKSENILVTTMDLSAAVNIKLSDYGISKFYHSGGNVGLVGTPGYQAPEIMEGLVYDEKVDIFSFAMVIYEVLSGERPFGDLKNLAQITRAVRVEAKRPSLKNLNIVTRFPMLEKMMEQCWNKIGTERPSATMIIADYMKHVKFICQHEVFEQKHSDIECITPIPEDCGKKELIWIWEGSGDGRCFSIFDLSGCCYHVHQQPVPGKLVTCMCKVDNEIWVGTEGDEDAGVIEIFAQKEMGIPKLQTTIECDGVPTFISYIDKPREEKKIYVTLHFGGLNVYCQSQETRATEGRRLTRKVVHKQWKLRKDQQISLSQANCMIYVPVNDELWIGCCHQIIIYSNRTMLVESKIDVDLALKQIFPKFSNNVCIQSLQIGLNSVWCLVQNTTLFLEFDMENKTPLNAYDCDQLSPKGMVILNKIDFTIPTVLQEEKDCTNSQPMPPPVPPRKTGTIIDKNRISDGSVSEYEITPPPLPPKTGTVRQPTAQQFPSIEPTDGLQNGKQKGSKTPHQRQFRPRFTSETIRTKTNTPTPTDQKYATLPSKDSTNRNRCDSFKPTVVVSSLAVVGDTMWVGRSIGDLLLVNIGSNHNHFQKGEVITVLNCSDNSTCTNIIDSDCNTEMLVHLPGHRLVVSVVKDGFITSRLVCWEAYTTENIRNIRKYWDLKKEGSSRPIGRRLMPKPEEKVFNSQEQF